MSTTETDEKLVERVLTEDKELYHFLVSRYQAKLLRYAKYLIKDQMSAEDVVQESFIKAYKHLHGFDAKRSFSSWIYRIVHNEAMNAVALKYRFDLDISDMLPFLASSSDQVEEQLEEKEMKELVRSGLEQLPLTYRSVLSLYYLEDKKYEEIAEIIKVPEGTVATRIHRSKKRLKSILLKEGKDYV